MKTNKNRWHRFRFGVSLIYQGHFVQQSTYISETSQLVPLEARGPKGLGMGLGLGSSGGSFWQHRKPQKAFTEQTKPLSHQLQVPWVSERTGL